MLNRLTRSHDNGVVSTTIYDEDEFEDFAVEYSTWGSNTKLLVFDGKGGVSVSGDSIEEFIENMEEHARDYSRQCAAVIRAIRGGVSHDIPEPELVPRNLDAESASYYGYDLAEFHLIYTAGQFAEHIGRNLYAHQKKWGKVSDTATREENQ